jgi:hypothetical protein
MAGSSNSESLVVPRELVLPSERSEPIRQFAERFRLSRKSIVTVLQQVPAVIDVVRGLDPRQLYTIEWPPEAVAALKQGTGIWKRNASGSLDTAIRAKNGGAFVKHLRLKEMHEAGVDLSALNNLAVQSALAEIIARLEELSSKVDAVLAGQRTDRQGLVDAGESTYLQALGCRHGDDRLHLLREAVVPLNTGRFQMLRSIESEALALAKPTGSAPLRGDTPTQRLAAAFGTIQQDMMTAMRATRSLVLVYEELRQPDAAKETVRHFAEILGKPAHTLRELAKYVPYSRSADHEEFWMKVDSKLVPAAHSSLRLLEAQRVLSEFTPADILGGTSDNM